MSFFGQPPQGQPPSMFGGQMDPRMMQMMHQRMQPQQQPMQPQGMPPGGMNPVNVPQQGLMPNQSPMMGQPPSGQMNPLASVLGNQGGATSPQGQMNDNGSAGGGNGMGGLSQILNALKSQQQVNGQSPMQTPGGVDIAALLRAQGGQ